MMIGCARIVPVKVNQFPKYQTDEKWGRVDTDGGGAVLWSQARLNPACRPAPQHRHEERKVYSSPAGPR
jgi:hypothetical protein